MAKSLAPIRPLDDGEPQSIGQSIEALIDASGALTDAISKGDLETRIRVGFGFLSFVRGKGNGPSFKSGITVVSSGIRDLVGFRKVHILNRHRAGAGKSGKTEFPSSSSDSRIIDEINKIANDPNAVGGIGKWDSLYKIGKVDGVEIRVDFYPSTHPALKGHVSTAYPINTLSNH